jgi:small subunit ribosomal protein S18
MDNVRESRDAQKPFRAHRKRKKVCIFCADKIDYIDYKDVAKLRKFTSERAKILPRRISGACAKHQRQITVAIKRARVVALMPFTSD